MTSWNVEHKTLLNDVGHSSDESGCGEQYQARLSADSKGGKHKAPSAIRGDSQWTLHHAVVFVLTFVSFMLVHAARKAFSNVKSTLQREWTAFGNCRPENSSMFCHVEPGELWRKDHVLFESSADAELFMGSLDTIFMIFYGAGLFLSGFLGDRLPLVWVLSVGMCTSAVATFLFGCVTEWSGYEQRWFYASLWAINGLAQSACWPSIVAIMANWFGKKGRGFVFGLWSANASSGNVLGALLVSAVLDFGYDTAFLVLSAVLLAGSIVNLFCLSEKPCESRGRFPAPVEVSELRNIERNGYSSPSNRPMPASQSIDIEQPVGFIEAWRIPGVLVYSLAYACLKLVTYSLFFWLPFYLTDSLHWSRLLSSKLSTLFDVGAIVGGTVGGIVSDWLGYRSPVFSGMLLVAVPVLFIYRQFGTTVVANSILMFAIGFWIGGPANLLSAAITIDIGENEKLKGNTKALATVAGIIDGTGSVGAAIGQYLVSLIETQSGWQNVIYFLMSMLFMATMCTSRLFLKECLELRRKHCRW